jgi:hypothetical protein
MSRQVVQQSVETFGFLIPKLTLNLHVMQQWLRVFVIDVLIKQSVLSGVSSKNTLVFGVA